MPQTDAQLALDLFPLAVVSLDALAADREFTFRVPCACTIVALEAAADAADSTDKYAASVRSGSTDIILTAVVTAADAVTRKTTAETNQSLNRSAGETLKVFIDVSGTAANVKGVYVAVWATRRFT